MERDFFDLGKSIVNGVFSGSTFLNILAIIGISVAGMLLKAFLEKLKEENPKLAYLIVSVLFLFVLYLIISEFQGEHSKTVIPSEQNGDNIPVPVTDSTSEFQGEHSKTVTPSEQNADDIPVPVTDSTPN